MTDSKKQEPSLAQKALTAAGIGATAGALFLGRKKLLKRNYKGPASHSGTAPTPSPAPKPSSPAPRLSYDLARKAALTKNAPTGFDYSKVKMGPTRVNSLKARVATPAPLAKSISSKPASPANPARMGPQRPAKYNPPMPTPSEIEKRDMDHIAKIVKKYHSTESNSRNRIVINEFKRMVDEGSRQMDQISNRSRRYALVPRNLYDKGRRESTDRLTGAMSELTK
jgi:hypothetical protein